MNMTIALAGNPNCGKTTLFNEITGSRQHVGNWPGVTVDKKEGFYKKNKEIMVLDLPGTYSLSPYSAEEIVARDYIVKERPDAVINIVDGTSLERNLYLTLQILETGIPAVLAVNMMDEVEAKGDKIDCGKLSELLQIPVVPIVARSGKGIHELMDVVAATVQNKTQAAELSVFDADIADSIHAIADVLGDADSSENTWKAIKLLEHDEVVEQTVPADKKDAVKVLTEAADKRADGDAEAKIADSRYAYW